MSGIFPTPHGPIAPQGPATWEPTGRARRAGLVVAGLVTLPLLLRLAKLPEGAKVVNAERFILRAADGKPRAELSLQDGRPSLALFDEKGSCRTRLSVLADGSTSLSLHDQDGQSRASLQVPREREPRRNLRTNNHPVPSPSRPVPVNVRPTPSKQNGEHLQPVQELFRQHCARCHGDDGRGRRSRSLENVPDFTDAAWQARRTNPQLSASILAGRNDAMPSFDGRLSAAEVRDLVALIRTFGPAAAAPADAPATDFEHQFRQLQQEYNELKKQLQEISPLPRRPRPDGR